MIALNLSEIAKWTKASLMGEDKRVTGVCTDTRSLCKGDLFVAIRGAQVDGHQFLQEAEKLGAAGALIEEQYLLSKLSELAESKAKWTLPLIVVNNSLQALGEISRCYRNQWKIPIAAVTGSCGKTTVKEMIASILSGHGPTLSNTGNLNTEVGLPLTLMRLEKNHQMAVVEMGARKQGDIRYLMEIASPNVTLITNAGVAHIEIFGSERGIAEAKGEIYANLCSNGTAVINLDEPHAPYWQSLLKGQKLVTFALHNKNNDAMLTAEIKQQTAENTLFLLKMAEGQISILLQAPGEHNISNALAAAAVAFAMGLSLSEIKQGLEKFKPVSGRLQFKTGKNKLRVIDDTYNANPVSMKAALSVLAAQASDTIFVMGDMLELGKEAKELHREMGREAKRLGIKHFLGLGSLTQSAVEAYGSLAKHYQDKATLIIALQQLLLSIQDNASTPVTVLVKGSRGMRMEEVVRALIETETSPTMQH